MHHNESLAAESLVAAAGHELRGQEDAAAGRRKGRGPTRLRLFLVMISALAVAMVSATASVSKAQASSTASGPSCDSSFNPYSYTQAQVQACGYATSPMLAAPNLAGGGSAVEYKINGMTVTDLIPPPGFRPETASAAQLDEYGFPARPTKPAQLATWKTEMAGWKGTAPPTSFLAETHSHVASDTATSGNWAG